MKPVDFKRTFAMNIILYYYALCQILSISKNMQSDSTTICDIHQQLNNIEVCNIYIFNIAE